MSLGDKPRVLWQVFGNQIVSPKCLTHRASQYCTTLVLLSSVPGDWVFPFGIRRPSILQESIIKRLWSFRTVDLLGLGLF